MADSHVDGTLVLPERTRLLYIGPMKTGTTAIQTAARDRRQYLLDHGVRYPGTRLNHRTELAGLMGRSTMVRNRTGPLGPEQHIFDSAGVPEPSHWDGLKAEIERDTSRRVLVTHEFVSQADDDTSGRIVDELGTDRIHVAITLRAPATILPSFWAQQVKAAAQTEPFDTWLARVYDPPPDNPMPDEFLRGYDQGELVRRWARLVGPSNVTVIVGDRSEPDLLTDAFETLLDLPTGALARGQGTNRSLTAVEAGLFHRLNISLREQDLDWRTFHDLVTNGAVKRGPLLRTPPADEPRMRLPAWASETAQADGKRFAERIRDAGVRVVGDLESLSTAPPTREGIDTGTVPTDIAVHALSGAVLAGQQAQQAHQRAGQRAKKADKRAAAAREKNQQLKSELATVKRELTRERKRTLYDRARSLPPTERPAHTAAAYTTRELLAALRRRLVHKLRTGRSHPLKPLPRP